LEKSNVGEEARKYRREDGHVWMEGMNVLAAPPRRPGERVKVRAAGRGGILIVDVFVE
tara:strand:- start:1049 stop:1222 length:174 start_codon:yes stop_codon:yes gene_type:complete